MHTHLCEPRSGARTMRVTLVITLYGVPFRCLLSPLGPFGAVSPCSSCSRPRILPGLSGASPLSSSAVSAILVLASASSGELGGSFPSFLCLLVRSGTLSVRLDWLVWLVSLGASAFCGFWTFVFDFLPGVPGIPCLLRAFGLPLALFWPPLEAFGASETLGWAAWAVRAPRTPCVPVGFVLRLCSPLWGWLLCCLGGYTYIYTYLQCM